MTTVDLIIPNGGGLATIKRLCRSLEKNPSKDLSLRVIIVSQDKDGGGDWLKEYEDKYENVFVIFNKDNIPPPVPYNDGLELSNSFLNKSDFIHFLDDDMEIYDGLYLNKMIEFYNKNDLGIMATEHCYFGPRPNPPNGIVEDFGMGSFLFKREIFDKLGCLDERFTFHCSDSSYVQSVKKLLKKKAAILPDSQRMLQHYHQLGTRRAFLGNHQSIIDRDWVTFKDKWDGSVKLEFQQRLIKEDRKINWSVKCLKETTSK